MAGSKHAGAWQAAALQAADPGQPWRCAGEGAPRTDGAWQQGWRGGGDWLAARGGCSDEAAGAGAS